MSAENLCDLIGIRTRDLVARSAVLEPKFTLLYCSIFVTKRSVLSQSVSTRLRILFPYDTFIPNIKKNSILENIISGLSFCPFLFLLQFILQHC
jgi:hypothetical protein